MFIINMYISHDICMIFPSQQTQNWIEREKLGVLRCKYHLYHPVFLGKPWVFHINPTFSEGNPRFCHQKPDPPGPSRPSRGR